MQRLNRTSCCGAGAALSQHAPTLSSGGIESYTGPPLSDSQQAMAAPTPQPSTAATAAPFLPASYPQSYAAMPYWERSSGVEAGAAAGAQAPDQAAARLPYAEGYYNPFDRFMPAGHGPAASEPATQLYALNMQYNNGKVRGIHCIAALLLCCTMTPARWVM
jgi:hypothetical protein